MRARPSAAKRKALRRRRLSDRRGVHGTANKRRATLEYLEPRVLLTAGLSESFGLPAANMPMGPELPTRSTPVVVDSTTDAVAWLIASDQKPDSQTYGPMPYGYQYDDLPGMSGPTNTAPSPKVPDDLTGPEAACWQDMMLDRIIVGFDESVQVDNPQQFPVAWQEQVISYLPIINAAVIEVDQPAGDQGVAVDQGVWNAVVHWSRQPNVRYAQPDYLLQVAATVPNDSRFGDLWGMNNTGQSGGTADADIDAPEAWDVFTGSSEVVVASIDTGVDYTHEDLVANMWVNPGEIAGNNIDDDGNGVIDDVHGFNARADNGKPMDDHGHGTHTAGTMGAVGNNGIGVAGVNWDVQIMALKFLSSTGSGSTSDAIECIQYMTDMKVNYGVNVVASNNSWSGSSSDQALYDAIEASNNAGIVFVAAAGNNALDIDVTPRYPAAYDLPGIISVAGTDRNDNSYSSTNYGSVSVDLGAPAVSILSTRPGNLYTYSTGTSMAAPHVAGAAAYIKGLDPDLTVAEVKDLILNNVDPVSSMAGITVTGGRLNLNNIAQDLSFRVVASTPAEGDVLTSPVSDFVIDFSEPYDPATVDSSDLTVNGMTAGSVVQTDADTLTFQFVSNPFMAQGPATMAIAEGAIEALDDSQPLVTWNAGLWYDLQPLEVTATSPTDGSNVNAPLTTLTIDFNEGVAGGSIGTDDLVLSQGQVAGAQQVNFATVQYTLTGVDQQGTFTFELPFGALSDTEGNPSQPYIGSLNLDITSGDFPLPLTPVAPLGSLVYESWTDGAITPGDADDTFLIDLDPGQTVTVAAYPDETLVPEIELLAPDASSLGVATAAGAGIDAVLQTAQASLAGTYSVVVSGAAASVGSYGLRLLLNAAVNNEAHDGPTDNTPGTAQDLDSSFIALGSGIADRGAVFDPQGGGGSAGPLLEVEPNDSISSANDLSGSFNSLGGNQYSAEAVGEISLGTDGDWDYYRIVAGPGDLLEVELRGADSSLGTLADPSLRLYDRVGNELAANDDFFGLESLLSYSDFTYAGDYYIVAESWGSSTGTYTLSATLNTSTPPDASADDWYAFSLDDGESASIVMVGQPDALMYLHDAAGTLLAAGIQTAELTQAIRGFQDATSNSVPDTYYVQVASRSSYQLVVTRGADFDTESNDPLAAAQYAPAVLGAVSGTGTAEGNVLSDFAGMRFSETGGYEPPDTHAAAGPNHIVEVVNVAIEMYNKDGSVAAQVQNLANFFDPSVVAGDGFLFDPVVAYDELADRWVVAVLSGASAGASETDLLYAVSDTSDPTGPWTEQHRIDFGGISPNLFADYPKIGFNADAHVFTLNMFASNFIDVNIVAIDKSSVLDTNASTFTHYISERPGTSFTMAAATMHDSVAGDPMWFVEEASFGNGSAIRAVRMNNVLSASPTYTDFQLSVDPYSLPPNAVQPGGTFETNDSRILNAELRGNRLVATHCVGVGGLASVRWYEIDITGGTATLAQQGNVDAGTGVHQYFPSIAINAAGDIGITFMQSSSTEYVSMYVTGQTAGSTAGTMQAPILVKAGDLTYSGSRGGDYSGITVDPVTDTFWAANEVSIDYPVSNPLWSTWIAEFSLEPAFESDFLRFAVNSGDPLQIRTYTPLDGPLEPVNDLDPSLGLYDPNGTLVASDSNSAPDGKNAQLSYTAQATGEYRVQVGGDAASVGGEYFAEVIGATGPDPSPWVLDVDPNDGAPVAVFPDSYVLHFSEALLLTSVDVTDLTVNGSTPASVEIVDGDTLSFDISGLDTGDGVYDVCLAAGSVSDLQGNTNAEACFTFIIDRVPPTIVGTSWNSAAFPAEATFDAGPLTFQATLSELLLTRSSARTGLKAPGKGDVQLVEHVTGTSIEPDAVSFDTGTLVFTAEFSSLPEGRYTLTLVSGDGGFEDQLGQDLDGEPLGGNLDGTPTGDGIAGGDYWINFDVDQVTTPASPFERLAPAASLISADSQVSVIHTAGDVDGFTLLADGGQVVSAVLQPQAAVTMSIEVVGVSGVYSAPSPGATVFLPPTPLPSDGVYEVRVTADGASQYELEIYKNTALESSVSGGDTSDGNELAIDNSHVTLGSGRLAVLGTSTPGNAIAYQASMDTDPGWTLDGGAGAWEYGVPQGQGGDPTGGNTGANVIGYDLGLGGNDGLYPNNLPAQYATTPAFDASGFGSLELSFYRWLGIEWSVFDSASIEVSTDNVNWSTVWEHTSDTFQETAWSYQTYDLSAAAGESTVYVRWSMGPTDGSIRYGGWNIDDVVVSGAGEPDEDEYTLDLTGYAGKTLDVILTGLGSADFSGDTLDLLDTDGTTVLDTAQPDYQGADITNYDLGIHDFVVPADGVYTIRLSSRTAGDYSLVVTDSLTFDTEPNDDATASLRTVDATKKAIGYTGTGTTGLYTSRAAFDNVFPGLPVEDFEEGLVGDGGVVVCPGPIQNGFVNACFGDPNDILPGIAVQDPTPGHPADEMALLGAGVIGNPSKMVGPTYFVENMEIIFPEGVGAVGMDVFLNVVATVGITVYGQNDTVLYSDSLATSPSGTFFGIATVTPITRIVVESADGELLDNVAFAPFDGPDRVAVTLNSNQPVLLVTETPFDNPALTPQNPLDPVLELYDSTNTLVAADSNSAADGKNAQLTFTASPAGGVYDIQVRGESGSGEYLVSVFSGVDLISVTPADDTTQVDPNTDLTMQFAGDMSKGTGSILIRKSSDDSVVDTIDVTLPEVTIVNGLVTIPPTVPLEGNTGYYVEVPAGTLLDEWGMGFVGISGPESWNFETGVAAGITISPTTGLQTTEDGATDNFTVVLESEPTENVIVTLQSDVQLEFSVDGGASFSDAGTLTFAPGQGGTPQGVIVRAIDDSDVEGNHSGLISFTSASADPSYDNLVTDALSVDIVDNETLQVVSVAINDGANQRSLVSDMTITFNADVSIAADAFTVVNHATQEEVVTSFTKTVDGNQAIVTISFLDGPSVNSFPGGNSLVDANYTLTIDHTKVTYNGLELEGNKPDGKFVFGEELVDAFFRLFGDGDGDRDVDNQDLGRFARTYGLTSSDDGFDPRFDRDFDGDVDNQDLGQFARRYGTTLPLD